MGRSSRPHQVRNMFFFRFHTLRDSLSLAHTGLTRVGSIRFLLIEIKHVLVYNSTIIYLTGLFVYTFSFEMNMPTKKYLRKKAKKLYLMGQIWIESHGFLKY